ncbi:hypothetical protein BH11PAT1_BH11PAT1_2760 [soil metagenome]
MREVKSNLFFPERSANEVEGFVEYAIYASTLLRSAQQKMPLAFSRLGSNKYFFKLKGFKECCHL